MKRTTWIGIFLMLLASRASAQSLSIHELTTGTQPAGAAFALNSAASPVGYAAVANRGGNSVSIFAQGAVGTNPSARVTLQTTLTGISAPAGMAECNGGQATSTPQFLATSPAANSVTLLNVTSALLTLPVGREPYSAACYLSPDRQLMAVVSNFAENTLSLIDVTRRTIVGSIADVPGSRSLSGIAVQGGRFAWVVGSDANTVTVVDLTERRITGRISVQKPTSIIASISSSGGIGTQTIFGVSSAAGITFYNGSTLQPTAAFSITDVQYFALFGGGGVLAIQQRADGSSALVLIQNNAVQPVPQIASPTFLAGSYLTSSQSGKAFLVIPTPQPPRDFAIVHAATFQPANGLAAGTLASLFAASTGVSQSFAATALPLPRTLGGVTLLIDGRLEFNNFQWSAVGGIEAPLLFVGPGQINFQIPPGIDPGNPLAPRLIPAVLRLPDGTTLTSAFTLRASAPGIFFRQLGGQTQPAILNQDGAQNGTPGATLAGRPAARGSVLIIYATGAGDTTPALLPGEPAPASGNPLIQTKVQPTVTIGDEQAQVLFSGMAPGFVGLWQINVEIPAGISPGPAVPLTISVGGAPSNTVTIAVE